MSSKPITENLLKDELDNDIIPEDAVENMSEVDGVVEVMKKTECFKTGMSKRRGYVPKKTGIFPEKKKTITMLKSAPSLT